MKQISCFCIVAGTFIFSLLGYSLAWSAEYSWQLRKNTDGVSVYTRKVEGSPILGYKASVTVNAPIKQVHDFFNDVTQIPHWYHRCKSAKLVADEGEKGQTFYVVIHMPWPVTDRDSVFHSMEAIDNDGSIIYTQTALPEYLPREKDKIRILKLTSMWRLTPKGNDRTEVYFEQHGDPGGLIPSIIVNALVVDIPFFSLKTFRDMIEAGKK